MSSAVLRFPVSIAWKKLMPSLVCVARAFFFDIPVIIGVALDDMETSFDNGAICCLDPGSGTEESEDVVLSWRAAWPSTRFIIRQESVARHEYLHDRPLRLWMAGTPFQHEVWRFLLTIPSGQTRTYGSIAACLSNPKASRAVGMACGANPVPLLVPCHRVVAANGGLGGYSGRGGVAFKQELLRREAA